MYPLVLILVILSSGVNTQLHLPGTCNFGNVNYIRGINTLFMGSWNQLERISNNMEQGECSRSEYELTNPISVFNSEVVDDEVRFRNGTMFQRANGVLNMTFADGNYDYVVMVTDYTNFALLYSCRNEVNNMKSVLSWKLSRRTTFTTAQADYIDGAVNANADLQSARWLQVAHTPAACRTNSSTALCITPLVLFYALLIIAKGYH